MLIYSFVSYRKDVRLAVFKQLRGARLYLGSLGSSPQSSSSLHHIRLLQICLGTVVLQLSNSFIDEVNRERHGQRSLPLIEGMLSLSVISNSLTTHCKAEDDVKVKNKPLQKSVGRCCMLTVREYTSTLS